MLRMTRFKYLLVVVVFLASASLLLLKYAPLIHEWWLSLGLEYIPGEILILSVLIVAAWDALATLSLLMAVLIVSYLERWRYLLVSLLVVIALASWLALHLLNYVSNIADRLADLFKVCWLALFFLALAALFKRKWRDLAIFFPVLFFTFSAFLTVYLSPPEKGGLMPNRWLQEAGFRVYALHLIRSTPIEEFLSRCKLVEYLEEDGTKQRVGECVKGLRSAFWFRIVVIYDSSGQAAVPAIERTPAWRLAVLHSPNVPSDVAEHLVGNFYWVLASPENF
jgi:hypothetical protein